MSRSSYGYVGRRAGGAAWQWVVIGMVLGFSCSVVLVLIGLAGGILSLDPNAVANAPTQTPFVITATAAPVTPSATPTFAPPTETQAVQLEVQAPTASPTIEMTFLTLQASTQATSSVAIGTLPTGGAGDTGGVNPLSAPEGGSFSSVISLASETVPIDGGTFAMGTTASEVSAAVEECLDGSTYGGVPGSCDPSFGEDAAPVHNVTLSAYSMEETEVSYQQFLAFMNALGPGSHRNGCDGQPCMQTRTDSETSNIQFDGANYSVPSVINDFPMANVTWYGAKAYCEAIGRRLPTEAEWEHAARGSNGYIYPWGNTWDSTLASTSRPASGEPGTVPIFSFPGGASIDYGVLNMAGNVAEWVSDWYDPRYYGRPEATGVDPQGPAAGTEKVARGGSWDAVPFFARTVHRQNWNPLQPTAWLGFRCVEDANSPAVNTNPLGANTLGTGDSDLALPTQPLGGDEEGGINSAPTIAPRPATATQSGPQPTLDPGG